MLNKNIQILKNNINYLFTKLTNLIKNFFQTILLLIFYKFDNMPFLLRNIEFIRYIQTVIFFFIQTTATTYFLIGQLNNIESNCMYFNKKYNLTKKLKKKFPKLYNKLEPFFLNFIKFLRHLRKKKFYNAWELRSLKRFILPAGFIRYLYVSKKSSALVNRTTNFLKKAFLMKPFYFLLDYSIEVFYNFSKKLLKYLIIYRKLWLIETLLNNKIGY